MRTISVAAVRRLAITKQRLAGARPRPNKEGLMEVARDLGCIQIDPIAVVERTHYIVPWSRLGSYDRADYELLMYEDRTLFEYWAHCASFVLMEEYPVHSMLMRRYAKGSSRYGDRDESSLWLQEVQSWMSENDELCRHILAEIETRGPLGSKDFPDMSKQGWSSTGWTGGRNVSRMLDFLWLSGMIMVAGRRSGQKLWDLAERVLPEWTPREVWPDEEVVRYAVQRSLRALGAGTSKHINLHYTRARYTGLNRVLKELESLGSISRVQVTNDKDEPLPGVWYIHAEDLPLLERIEAGEWEGRTTLLSPFDNLICDRDRTETLFNFYFRIEIYVPKEKREYGYYVLPILHGDRLIGRIDPQMDRKRKTLTVNAVHAEPDAPQDAATGRKVAKTIHDLAAFLGASNVDYPGSIPEGWRKALRA